jgi:hypothetical protein
MSKSHNLRRALGNLHLLDAQDAAGNATSHRLCYCAPRTVSGQVLVNAVSGHLQET